MEKISAEEPLTATGWLPLGSSQVEIDLMEVDEVDQSSRKAPRSRAFKKEVVPDEVLTFGKHKGLTFQETLQKDALYALWCSEQPSASLAMRRFIKFAEDAGIVEVEVPKPKRQKAELQTTPPGPPPSSDAMAAFESFAFQPQSSSPPGYQQEVPPWRRVVQPDAAQQQLILQ
eukprot:CAMPEP_0115070024 /NCGR_PEP_ID=MMETSP0227-20121206/12881_1 /TAXON_ID=89957 /ORGANISM="Polarella glacialis, Strain CCMP 1383" /LENGTH=172 /DNA_ID=CAMNT_0002456487 /DNA_START=128 /DNA_END=643 /DNA_ORIENTATION=-